MFWDLSDLLVPTSLWVCFNARFQWCVVARFAFSLFVACVYMYHHVFQPRSIIILFRFVSVFFLLLLSLLLLLFSACVIHTTLVKQTPFFVWIEAHESAHGKVNMNLIAADRSSTWFVRKVNTWRRIPFCSLPVSLSLREVRFRARIEMNWLFVLWMCCLYFKMLWWLNV